MSVRVVLSSIRVFLILLLTGSSLGCSSEPRGMAAGSGQTSAERHLLPADSDTLAAPKERKDTLTFAFVGDIMMGTTFPTRQLPANGGKDLFRDVAALLRQADVAAGNLEGTLCDSGETKKKVSAVSYAFRTPTSYSHYLKEAGFDFLSMANNHAHDFGTDGIRSTERELDSLGIGRCGIAGRQEFAIVERAGMKVGFCAFGHNSYTIMHTDTACVGRLIRKVRPLVDILVVSFHGGAEGAAASHLPQGKELFLGENRGSLRQLAHQCIDLGADIVYGHGPHVPRCMELYKGKIVAYSLGNFCTPRSINLKGISGYAPLLEVKVDSQGNFIEGQIHSFVQQPGVGPRKDPQNRAAALIRDLTKSDVSSPKLSFGADGKIQKAQ